jgi:ABC-type sugar transport system permease subunit
VVVGYLWKGLFNHDLGLINALISTLGIRKQGFLSDPKQALLSLIITSVWKSRPCFMMIFLAGLKEIPVELYESARIDGAG